MASWLLKSFKFGIVAVVPPFFVCLAVLMACAIVALLIPPVAPPLEAFMEWLHALMLVYYGTLGQVADGIQEMLLMILNPWEDAIEWALGRLLPSWAVFVVTLAPIGAAIFWVTNVLSPPEYPAGHDELARGYRDPHVDELVATASSSFVEVRTRAEEAGTTLSEDEVKQLASARTVVSQYGAVAATPHTGVKAVSNVSVLPDSKEAIGDAILLLLSSGLYPDLSPELRNVFANLSMYQSGIGGEALFFCDSGEVDDASGDRVEALRAQSAAAAAWMEIRLSEYQDRMRQIAEEGVDEPISAGPEQQKDPHW